MKKCKQHRNILNSFKQIDLFKNSIKMRTERSTQGQMWDEEGGSFFGMAITIGIYVIAALYTI